jgi:hypothetical protein
LVEQLIRNQQVIGSSPIVGSISVSFLAFPYRVWYRLSTVFLRDRLRSLTPIRIIASEAEVRGV